MGEFVDIPGGTFTVSCSQGDSEYNDDEKSPHNVAVKLFRMGKYKVTFAQWDACVVEGECSQNPGDEGWGRGKLPVVNVSWDDAVAYAAWFSEQTGKKYRLPSEAEWEYAARAGTTTAYWWGDEASKDRAKYGALFGGPVSVGSFPANAFGLYDTAGNVWEWTQDCRNKNYNGAPADGTAWQSGDCEEHVGRGGSWFGFPDRLRSADRGRFAPELPHHHPLGFRLVQDLD